MAFAQKSELRKERVRREDPMTTQPYQGLIKKYRKYLPVKEKCIVSLLEGNTPLLECKNLPKEIGLNAKLYLKFEGLNPTCSFKDRGMTYAISKALEGGSQAVICASTGNTSASAAAYAARAGMQAVVLIPKGKIAFGKLSQAIRYGAKIIQINGNFDDALKAVIEIGENYPISIVNSVNPYRLQGQMTASFEVFEQLAGKVPDYHFLPVGNAGNISAYWMGYQALKSEKKTKKLPKMMGFQASGSAPIVLGKPVANPETIATAIRIGNPASWDKAVNARDESKGVIDKVTDREILKAYDLLAKTEGFFCEPASAAGVAGLIKLLKQGKQFTKNQKIVCTLTGHGLKDPDTAVKGAKNLLSSSVKVKDIVKKIGLKG